MSIFSLISSRGGAGAFLLLLAFLFLPAYAQTADAPKRVVAVADIHGAYDAFVQILQRAELVDGNQHWNGKQSIFVQTGDVLDRGSKGRQSLDLLMQLEKEAPSQKGKIVALIGNHEMMNILGDLRYVPKEEYANYADAQSVKRQDEAYTAYQQWRSEEAKTANQTQSAPAASDEQAWKQMHPPGFVEQRAAFAPDGKYGRWLRKHQAAARIDDVLFVHGGISQAMVNLTLDDINRRVAAEIRLYDTAFQYLAEQKRILPFFTIEEVLPAANQEVERLSKNPREQDRQMIQVLQTLLTLGSWLSMSENGPLWFRGFAEWSDQEAATNLPPLLKAYKVNHFVVGHTVEPKGTIVSRLQNAIFCIDTGMNSAVYQGGRASALVWDGRTFTTIYNGS